MASRTPPSDVLAAWLPRQRWFATKTRGIEGVRLEDVVPLAAGSLALARVALAGGRSDCYAIALAGPAGSSAADVPDAFDEPLFCRALLDLVSRGADLSGDRGRLRGRATAFFPRELPPGLPVRRLGREQSNTSVAFGDVAIMKLFRRLQEGVNPEEEMTRFLTERARFLHTPRLWGHLDYARAGGAPITLAVVQELVPGARDGWEWILEALRGGAETSAPLRRLGAITGALHLALASEPHDPEFVPEPITPADLATWRSDVEAQLERARAALGAGSALPTVPDLGVGLDALRGHHKIRHHGDLHLGQTLYRPTTGDFVLIDFEGEPLRPLSERRRKHTPLRDVAGVLRSLHYAVATARPTDGEAQAEAWETEAASVFLAGYRETTAGASFVPASDTAFRAAVAVFEVEKAAYEVVYEANHRPDWVTIPQRGLVRAAARLRRQTAGAA